MRLSKMTYTHIKSAAFSLSLTIGLLGCTLPTPQKADVDESASYYVSKMDGKFTNTENHPRISIPVSKSMSLTACLRENNHSRQILNHAYTIKGGEKDIDMETDADGCLVWEEDLAFNYLADENYIYLKRTLVPHGYMTGTRDIQFIINPWSGKILSSIDSKVKDPIPAAQSKIALFGKSQKARRSLWMDWVRLNIMQEQISHQKGSYTIEVSGTLLFERLDQNRELQLIPASYAQVHGRIQLICNINPADKGPLKVVIAQMEDVKGNVVNGNKIFLNGKFTLSEFCPSTGFLTAGVSIDVPNGPEHLAPFHGLYHAGPVQNMIGNNFSAPDGDFMDRFKANRNYSVDQYLRDNQTWYRNGTKALASFGTKDRGQTITTTNRPGQVDVRPNGNGPENGNGDIPDLLQKFRIEVQPLVPSFYGYPEQNLKTRTLYFRLNACMILGIDRMPIRAVTFKIHKINGQSDDKTTMNDGCIEWEDSITYNAFAHEGWYNKEVRLVSKTYGFDEKIAVQINPWNRSEAWFKDLRWLPSGDRVARWKKEPSQILLDYYFFDYSTNRYNYMVDEFLNLNHRRQANMSFKPSLYRPTFRDDKGYVSEALPAGRYLMRYALVDQSVTDYQNIAALKDRIYAVDRSIINVREDGAVIDQLSFWIHSESVISLGLLNQIVVELVPLKEGVTLSSSTTGEALESFVDHDNAIQVLPHVAQFIHRGEGGGLRKLDRYAGQSLILEYEKLNKKSQTDLYTNQKRMAKKEAFAAVNHLKLVNLNDEQGSLKVRTDIANALGRLPVYAVHEKGPTEPPLESAHLKNMVNSGKIDRSLAVRLCGYIFRNLWSEKLPGKNHGLVNNTDHEKDLRLYHLQADCVRLFDKDPTEAFDIEFDYIVERPQFVPKITCQSDAGQNQCFREIVPERVDPRTFSVSNAFTMSRSYAASMSTGASVAGSGGLSKFVGINGSYGYEIGDNEAIAEGNNVNFGLDLSMVLETLRFKIAAPNAERCMMVRLNPVLLDRVESGWSLFGWDFTEKTSIYAQALHPDLTEEERFVARRKGVLFCEGTKMNREIRFSESYYLLRPSTPMGLVGDERSRATVEGLFASLRGINDMTAFLSQVMNADKIPASFYREFQARKLDTTRLREAFFRGTRAIPGVYSSPVPLK